MLPIIERVNTLAKKCLANGYKIAAAESCTGGWLSHAIISEEGSSAWFEGSLVSYSLSTKTRWLQVPEALIETQGAVSEAVARAMLAGVLATHVATHAVAITGFAGPSGDEVGLVWFAWGTQSGEVRVMHHELLGDRTQIREQAVLIALDGLLKLLPSA